MNGTKGLLASVGIIGGSVAAGSGFANFSSEQLADAIIYFLMLFGFVGSSDVVELRPHVIVLISSITAITAAIGGVLAVWGRIRANKQIKGLICLAACVLCVGCSATDERTIYIGTIDGDLTVRAVGSHNQGRPTDGFVGNASGEIPLAALGIPGTGSIPVNLGMITPPAVDGTSGIYADHVGGSVTIETIGSGNQLFDSIEAAALQDKSSNTNLGGYEAKWAPPDDDDAVNETPESEIKR